MAHQEVSQPVTAPIEVDPAASAPPEAVLQGLGKKIEGRSLSQIAWMRLRRDKVALAGGAVVILLVVFAIFAPLIVGLLGHPPDEFHQELVNADTQVPIGKWGGISRDFLFGVEPVNGRDLFSRVLYGAQISLLIATSFSREGFSIFGSWTSSWPSRCWSSRWPWPGSCRTRRSASRVTS